MTSLADNPPSKTCGTDELRAVDFKGRTLSALPTATVALRHEVRHCVSHLDLHMTFSSLFQ